MPAWRCIIAGDWIKFETSTSDKPEVWYIASKLSIDPDAVVGKLLRIWVWFDAQSLNGNAPSVTKLLLDRQVGVTGFCNSMIESGWMLDDGSEIRLPNFDRHNGETAKNRAQTAKRVAKHRMNVTEPALQQRYNSVTKPVTSSLPEKITEKKRDREELEDKDTASAVTPADVLTVWNSKMKQKCRMTDKRKATAKLRIKNPDWLAIFEAAIDRCAESDFCNGRTDGGSWVADFEWFLKPDSATKLIEGKYDNRKKSVSSGVTYAGSVTSGNHGVM